MNNTISMSAEFERQKNFRASVLTAICAGLVLLVIILIKMTTPVKQEPVVDDFVEIELPNLGSSDVGSGTDQPQLPGDPAPAQQTAYTPPQTTQSTEEAVKDVSNDDEKSNDAPPVIKPNVSKPNATRINEEAKTVKTNNVTPSPVVAPPKPKATLGRTVGGNGNGGNGSDTYKPGSGEGQGGGPGDQGVPGGDPNGKNYSGSPRNLGVRIVNIPAQNFEDDFNESGKIALDIVVNENGKLVSASYQISGSTLPKSSKQYTIALRRAAEINYPKYDGGFKQRLTLNFNVK
jgi:hypothetical protein